MRFLTADFIFSAHTGFIPNGILAVEDDGTIAELVDPSKAETVPEAEKLEGILCPGFINAHCHLELSHLRGQISKRTGFVGFAKELLPKRGQFTQVQIAEAIERAEEEMAKNGIVGVGDISNTADTFAQKEKSNLRYHTFIELLALDPQRAETVLENGKALLKACPQTASLAPHAPYSVSAKLLELIGNSSSERFPLTIHSEESLAESEFIEKGTGNILDLYDFLGMDISWYQPTGEGSLRSTLVHLPVDRNLLLVHNTFTTGEEIAWAENYNQNLWWCFCPNANLYIENSLPDFRTFLDAKVRIAVGTDSLASNDGLSILEELKVIAAHAPEISLGDLLTWATKNGAEALRFDELGTFEKNKRPGVIQLSGLEQIVTETQTPNVRLGSAAKVARVI